jgi:hypothetical protein
MTYEFEEKTNKNTEWKPHPDLKANWDFYQSHEVHKKYPFDGFFVEVEFINHKGGKLPHICFIGKRYLLDFPKGNHSRPLSFHMASEEFKKTFTHLVNNLIGLEKRRAK